MPAPRPRSPLFHSGDPTLAVVEAGKLIRKYGDLDIGLADASTVVLADRHGTLDILTLDERRFQPLRSGRGRPFRLLPFDA